MEWFLLDLFMNLTEINFEEVSIELVLKNIKNIHIRIYPPFGRVRVSAPHRMNLERICSFISSRINWIKDKQKIIRSKKWNMPQQYKSGETHYFLGQKYELEVIEENKKPNVIIVDKRLILQVRPHSNKKQKQLVLQKWYRASLKEIVNQLIKEWEVKMKVVVAEFKIKKMKTRWGTCNPKARRIWINLELAKKSPQCLEYIVVHEMVHFFERKHNANFFAYMDNFLPQWRDLRMELKS